MNEQKSLLLKIAEVIDCHLRRHDSQGKRALSGKRRPSWLRWLARHMVPNIGTLLMVVVLLLTMPSLAAPLRAPSATSTSTISYQGRLSDSSGNPLTGKYNLEFRIYDVPTGGTPLWTEMWTGSNAVDVSDGLFNVMLGSIENTLTESIEGHDELYLGITVGADSEMEPRVQLGSVPFSIQAMTVADGSITTEKIADGAVEASDIAASAVEGEHITHGGVSGAKISNDAITTTHISDGAVTTAKIQVDDGLSMSGNLALSNGRIAVGTAVDGMLTVGRSDDPGYTTKIDGNMITIDDGGFAPAHVNSFWDNLFLYTDEGSVYIRGHDGETEDLIVSGNLTVNGTKSSVVNLKRYGQRTLYAVESPEVRFCDEGLAQLENGVARVDLDPIFVDAIEGEYLVHVTPYGNTNLYVAEINGDYFTVRAREGASTAAFAWRLSARRKGYADVRLEAVEELKGAGQSSDR